jgi:hypothetical protein
MSELYLSAFLLVTGLCLGLAIGIWIGRWLHRPDTQPPTSYYYLDYQGDDPEIVIRGEPVVEAMVDFDYAWGIETGEAKRHD